MENTLPKNWVETELGNFAFLKNGYAYKTTQFTDEGIPILKISNITKTGKVDISEPQFVSEKDLNESFLVKKGDIVLAMSGATTGKFGIYESDAVLLQNQRVGNLKLHSDLHGNKKFLFYLLASLKKEIEDRAYGGAQPNISPTLIESIFIGLPPLPEQERIVAKLDALFAQHERMKQALDKIPQLLKDFRQQVLSQAITGKLTEEWREGKDLEIDFKLINNYLKGFKRWKSINTEVKNTQIPELWKLVKLGNVSYISNGSTPSRKEKIYWNGHIPWIGSGSIQNNRISKSEEFITEEGLKNSSTKILPIGTVLLAMIGEGKTRAQSSIINIEVTINQNIASIEINHGQMLPEFLQYFLLKNYDFHRTIGNGTGPKALNCQKVKEFDFVLPPLLEQQEIVSRVETLFAKADTIEARYQKLKEKINALPQALLHKSFKGELVPQLPTDGDAKDLLAEILKLKEDTKPKGKKK